MSIPKFIRVECTKVSCPQFGKCPQVLTTIRINNQNQVDIMFVGEAAGREEYEQSMPFVGQSGKFLKRVIENIDVTNDKTYAISNIVRCWPTQGPLPEDLNKAYKSGNPPITRRPNDQEIFNCLDYLHRDIETLKPKVIIALGATPFNVLSRSDRKITSSRGKWHTIDIKGIKYPMMPTYHPAACLRNPTWADPMERDIRQAFSGQIEVKPENSAHEILTKISDVKAFYDDMKNHKGVIAFDTETFNLSRLHNKLGTMQFSLNKNSAVVVPVYHPETPFSPEELQELIKLTTDLFTAPVTHKGWIAHNMKFELNIIKQTCGVWIRNATLWDTQVAAFLMDENRLKRNDNEYGIYSLKALAKDLLNFDGYDKGVLKVREEGNLMDLPLKELAAYAAMDSQITFALWVHLLEQAQKQQYFNKMVNLMKYLYSPFILLAASMERNGFKVDMRHLRELTSPRSALLVRKKEIEEELKTNKNAQKANELLVLEKSKGVRPTFGGMPWMFDFTKKDHPQKLFYDVLSLVPLSTGKSGQHSVDSSFQEAYEKRVPEVALFSEHVLMNKMFDSFATKLMERVDPESKVDVDARTDGRIRSDFLYTNTVTGRIACRNPNTQAIPRASENAAKTAIKNIFACEEGNALVQLDFKANEVRWMAIVAKENSWAKIFNNAKKLLDEYKASPTDELKNKYELYSDVHKANASLAFNKAISQVTKIERQKSKCLSKGTLTPTKRGFLPIEETQVGDFVWNGEWTEVKGLHTEESSLHKITTDRGWNIDVSEGHKLHIFDRRDLTIKFLLIEEINTKYHYIPLRRQDSFDFPEVDLSGFKPDDVSEDKLSCPICGEKFHMLHTHMRMLHKVDAKMAREKYGLKKLESDHINRKIALIQAGNNAPKFYPTAVTEDLAWLLGCLISEGAINTTEKYGGISFCQTKDMRYYNEYRRVHKRLFGVSPTTVITNKKYKNLGKMASSSSYVRQFIEFCGYHGCADEKEVPWCILRAPKSCQAAFLRGYFSGDGSTPKKGIRNIKASSASEKLIKQLSVLFWNFGIINSLGSCLHRLPKKQIWRKYYYLTISGEDFDKYFERIGKSHNIKHRGRQRRHQKDWLPGLIDVLRQIKKENPKLYKRPYNIHDSVHLIKELSWHEIDSHFNEGRKYKQFLLDTKRHDVLERLELLMKERPFLAQVKSVTPLNKIETVYDLTLDPKKPYFVANAAMHWDCLVFGLLFDETVEGVAESMNVTVEEAQHIFNTFYKNIPETISWKKKTKYFAQTHGYTESLQGRRRRLPIFKMYGGKEEIQSRDERKMWNEALRQATNSYIQGLASDCAMMAASLFNNYVLDNKKNWVMVNCVHDSAVVEAPILDVEEVLNVMEHIFTDGIMQYMTEHFGIEFNLPLDIDFAIGKRWGELIEWDRSPQGLKEVLKQLGISHE